MLNCRWNSAADERLLTYPPLLLPANQPHTPIQPPHEREVTSPTLQRLLAQIRCDDARHPLRSGSIQPSAARADNAAGIPSSFSDWQEGWKGQARSWKRVAISASRGYSQRTSISTRVSYTVFIRTRPAVESVQLVT